jgi:predicted PurR-regulated permease PerM
MSSYLSSEENRRRERRGRIVYAVALTIAGLGGLALLWALRGLMLPLAIGAVMAYLCLPLIGYLKDKGFSHFWAILCLSGFFCLLLFSALRLASSIIPDQQTELELQVRARYKVNNKFNRLMGLDNEKHRGNWLYSLAGPELEPIREKIDTILALSAEDQQLFTSYHEATDNLRGRPVPEKYWQYHQANQARDREQPKIPGQGEASATEVFFAPSQAGHHHSLLRTIISTASLWLVTPLVFLTLLFDDGRLKQGLIRSVPNRYFELTLTLIDNINTALGRYLRGTAMECLLVGASFSLCLFLIGVDPRWSVIIGAIAGIANAIPFLGTAIGLIVGIIYAVMAEEISPLLPFVNDTNLILAIAASVFLVHLADNAIFQPYILGSAVNLHPLIVILGVMGGTLLFGFAGMLFAIPAIIVSKVVVSTTFRQLRAYYII